VLVVVTIRIVNRYVIIYIRYVNLRTFSNVPDIEIIVHKMNILESYFMIFHRFDCFRSINFNIYKK